MLHKPTKFYFQTKSLYKKTQTGPSQPELFKEGVE